VPSEQSSPDTTDEPRYWETVAEEWIQALPHSLWRKHSDAVNHALLARWLPATPVARLLKTDVFDESVSDGLYPLLIEHAETVVGMDVSLITLRVAQSRAAGNHFTCADVRGLPFADGVFDVIVSNSTLDHFETTDELIASLRQLHRVLRRGGELLLTLDNHTNPAIVIRNALPFDLLRRLGIVPYYVGATFGPRRLRRTLHDLGMEIVELGAIMHCPRVFAVKLAGILQMRTRPETQQKFLRWLIGWERLARWPTRHLTGHFVAVRAVKR
jgi:SAM-dependent methyltransferase